MSRMVDAVRRGTSEGRKLLVTYLCVGDPSEEESIELAVACAEAGADILELGSPFSDPTADGPAIARASQRAIARGGGLAQTLRVAKAVRARTNVPIILFGYYNPLFQHGEERVARAAADAGIDALLVVDLPLDAAGSLRAAAGAHDIAVIPLVAPTTRTERIAEIARVAIEHPIPFVYYVSTTGVTGGAGVVSALADAGAQAARVRELTQIPTVVGFGIDAPERARAASASADGVVVGTAIVKRIEDSPSESKRIASVRALVGELRAVL